MDNKTSGKSNSLHVHGKVSRISTEEGGAAKVQIDIDQFENKIGVPTLISDAQSVTFFSPNHDPKAVEIGAHVWAHLELFADWKNLSLASSKQVKVESLHSDPDTYEYSISGEIFLWPSSGRGRSLYVDAGFPIFLRLGSPPYPHKIGDLVKNGQFIHLSKGRLYGYLEIRNPDLEPWRPL